MRMRVCEYVCMDVCTYVWTHYVRAIYIMYKMLVRKCVKHKKDVSHREGIERE
jgi:hypothetical protein